MKEKMKKYCVGHWKIIMGAITVVVIAGGILIFPKLESKQILMDTISETQDNELISDKESQPTEVPEVKETSQVGETPLGEETKELVMESSEASEEINSVTVIPTVEAKDSKTETPSVTRKTETKAEMKSETKSEKVTTSVMKPIEKQANQSEPIVIVEPTTEAKYVPISEGWKEEASAKGDISSAQKADIDSMIQAWKSGALTDADLKEEIISYLEEQKIDYMEVSVTSNGYALYDTIPGIDLRDGGNIYSFVGTYSTGKQNPDGTNKTVCYNWSAFIF